MALDTLEIFGEEFTNVTGIKATDDNDQIKVYIRPQGTKSISANGTGIDVAEYASVDVSVPSSGVDIPVFTASWNQNYELISASCSETFAQCYTRYNNGDVSAYYHGIFDVDGDSWDGYYSLTVRSANSNEIVYTYFYGAYPASDIVYRSNGQINFVDPSSASLTLNVTSNGDYYPSDGVYTEVHVSVPSGSPTLQTKTKTYTPSTTQQTESVSADSGYDGLDTVSVTVNAMPTGTAGTPTATKGTVSNHQVSVTPSVTNTTGYITGSTKTGTAVTVSASELVSGSQTITSNQTVDVTNLAEVVVNVSGGTSKNTQVVQGTTRTTKSAMTAIGAELTVSKTGTYDIYWDAVRSTTSTSYTYATQLYIDGTAYGSEDSTWSNHIQSNHLSNVSLTANQKIRVYGRNSRGSSYYIYAPTLVIIEA